MPTASWRRTDELRKPERGGFADNEPEFLTRHVVLGPLFHSEWDDAERLERGGRARDGGHRRFNADIVRAGGAAANANPFAASHHAEIGGAPGRSQVKIAARQYLDRRSATFASPLIESSQDSVAQDFGFEHAAIKEDGGWVRELFLALAGRQLLHQDFVVALQEPGQVLGDGRIGRIRETQFLQTNTR